MQSTIDEFSSITRASAKQARGVLREAQGDLRQALDIWYSRGMVPDTVPKTDDKKIKALFSKYKDDEDEGLMGPEGVMAFGEDIGVDVSSDVGILVFAYYCDAKTMGEFTQEEFIKGCKATGADSIEKLKKALPSLREQLKEFAFFKSFYNWLYDYGVEDQKRKLRMEVAKGLLALVLDEQRFPLLKEWLEFMEVRPAAVATLEIPAATLRPQTLKDEYFRKDTWRLLLDFGRNVNPDLSNYDGGDDSPWPIVIDDFVAWAKAKRGQGEKK